jgi:hypothetical protein
VAVVSRRARQSARRPPDRGAGVGGGHAIRSTALLAPALLSFHELLLSEKVLR